MTFKLFTAALPCALLICLAPTAKAEKADREKPVNIEADKLSVDDKSKTQVFEGRVKLVQGTLVILAERIIVTQDAVGFQKGTATGGEGGLARFRQKREGRDEYVDGEAERIEYDGRTDQAQLFQRAYVKSGRDEVHGQYIQYDGVSENYTVTNGANNGANDNGRVTATIQPGRPAAPSSSASAPVVTPTKP